MKGVKKLVAAAVAAVSIGAIGVTASAAETLPADWMAVYQHGAPTSVNKQYVCTVPYRNKGYTLSCTYFNGGDGSFVKITTPHGDSFYIYGEASEIGTFTSITGSNTFVFSALGSPTNISAGGKIKAAS